MLQTRSACPCSLCLLGPKEASRNHRKGLGMSKQRYTYHESHIDDIINFGNCKHPHRCCVYWKEKTQAMCKYDFCYNASGKGSGEQKVWLNHTSFPITSTPNSSPIPCLCHHLTFNASSLPVRAPHNPPPHSHPLRLPDCLFIMWWLLFSSSLSKPLPSSSLPKEEWQEPQERQLKFS